MSAGDAEANHGLAPGVEVAGHRIVRALGHGGFGVVFEAVDLALDRPVALKLLQGGDAGLMARFRDEARLLARINDPHVIQIYRIDRLPSGQPFLTMELFGAGALGRHVTKGQPAPLHFAVAVVRQVLAALAAAHAGGIVHRDIKEANILVDPARPAVKVCDFGIARAQNPGDREAPATGHGVLGTPHYIAPERFRGVHDDPRSDLYSVGVVFHRLLTGRRPFDMAGAGALEIAHRVCTEDVPPLRGVPPAVSRACLDLLARDPDARPPDAWAAIAALDRALEGPATVVELEAAAAAAVALSRTPASHPALRAVATSRLPNPAPRPVAPEASAVLDLEALGGSWAPADEPATASAASAASATASAPPPTPAEPPRPGPLESAAMPATHPLGVPPGGPGGPAARGPTRADHRLAALAPTDSLSPDRRQARDASGASLESEPPETEPTASSAVLAWEATDSGDLARRRVGPAARLAGPLGLIGAAAALALGLWAALGGGSGPEVSAEASVAPGAAASRTTPARSAATAAVGVADATAPTPIPVLAVPTRDAPPRQPGPPEAGPPDARPPDAGPPDAGPPDAGPPDAGPPDAGPPDAGPPDDATSAPSASPDDAARPVAPDAVAPTPDAVAPTPDAAPTSAVGVISAPTSAAVARPRDRPPAALAGRGATDRKRPAAAAATRTPVIRPATRPAVTPAADDSRRARTSTVFDDPFVVPAQ